MLDVLSASGKAKIPWDDRIAKGFFRGRDSSRQRLELVKLGKKHPDLFDVGITRYFFFRDKKEELGTKEQAPFFDFFKVNVSVFN